MPSDTVKVIGYSSYNRKASASLLFLSTVLDLCVILSLSTIALVALGLPPIPQVSTISLFLSIAATYWIAQRLLLGTTLGERTWWIRRHANSNRIFRRALLQSDFVSPPTLFLSSLVTTLSVLLAFTLLHNMALHYPVFMKASHWELKPFIPEQRDAWTVLPFYYGVAGWPKTFGNKPISYSLPYEYGPPAQFVGHIQAILESPDLKLTFEGPKTPLSAQNNQDPAELRNCFSENSSLLSCFQIRQESLSRHIKEMERRAPTAWELRWFTIQQPNQAKEALTQGIYLKASGPGWIEDRFILVNAKGAHQAVILDRPRTPQGDLAFALLEKSIRSLRLFDNLESTRAWVDRELSEINLPALATLKDPQALTTAFYHVQSLLLSKISVDPGSFDAYYHLAGTSSLIFEKLYAPAIAAGKTKSVSAEITARIQMIESAYRYAHDIATKTRDPRLVEIQNLWLASKKWR